MYKQYFSSKNNCNHLYMQILTETNKKKISLDSQLFSFATDFYACNNFMWVIVNLYYVIKRYQQLPFTTALVKDCSFTYRGGNYIPLWKKVPGGSSSWWSRQARTTLGMTDVGRLRVRHRRQQGSVCKDTLLGDRGARQKPVVKKWNVFVQVALREGLS